MAARVSSAIQLILAVSIFYLGYSINAVINKVDHVLEVYPEMAEQLNVLSTSLKIDEWLEIADDVNIELPKITAALQEAAVVLKESNDAVVSFDSKIPRFLDEVTQYRESVIPMLVNETAEFREEATQFRTQVLPPLLIETKAYREGTVPSLIAESQALRKEIPPLLDQTERIVEKSNEVAKEATSGAVKGVIMSPIDMMKDAGSEIKQRVTEESEPNQQ